VIYKILRDKGTTVEEASAKKAALWSGGAEAAEEITRTAKNSKNKPWSMYVFAFTYENLCKRTYTSDKQKKS